MKDLFSLKGRIALVTGGSRGIGRMIAEGFLHHGAKVYISARKGGPLEETAKELSKIGPCIALTTNTSGADGAKAMAAAASKDKLAKVINIASIDGIAVNPQETYSYHASKAGLIHLTKRMAIRLIRDNIVVSAIAPGAFASDMNRDARDHGDALAKVIPSRRIGTAEDMAGAAIYLASRAGDYVVGSTIVVDGGVSYMRGGN